MEGQNIGSHLVDHLSDSPLQHKPVERNGIARSGIAIKDIDLQRERRDS